MECPRCLSSFTTERDDCPNCGLDLSILQELARLRREVERNLGDITRSLSDTQTFLKQRLASLESTWSFTIKNLARTEKKPASAEGPTAVVLINPDKTVETETPRVESTPPIETPPPSEPLPHFSKPSSPLDEIQLGQKWLLIAGVIAIVFGVGYFLKYSFDHNWIGPWARVLMAYGLGAALLVGGEMFRRGALSMFGLALMGGGIATLYFSTFAAFQIYQLIGQTLAFILMIVVTIFTGVLSISYDNKYFATLGIFGGFLTPVLLGTGSDNQPALMTYLTLLNVGVLYISYLKDWRALVRLAFFFTWSIFTAWYFKYFPHNYLLPEFPTQKFWLTLFFIQVFFVLYTVIPFAYELKRKASYELRYNWILPVNALTAFGFCFAVIKEFSSVIYTAIPAVAYAGWFIFLAQFIYRRAPQIQTAFTLFLAQATVFLVLAVPQIFNAHWTTFVWAVQATALLIAALSLKAERLTIGSLLLLGLALCKFYFSDIFHSFGFDAESFIYNTPYFENFATRIIASVGILAALFFSAREIYNRQVFEWLDFIKIVVSVLFLFALFITLNIEVGTCIHYYAPTARFAAHSVLWALFSIAMIIVGFRKNNATLRFGGIGLFALTGLKVVFVDMHNVDVPFRIISLIVLGILSIAASYLYHRYRDKLIPPTNEKSTNQP